MKNGNQKPCLEQLLADLVSLLESKGYKTGTMDNYRRTLNQISVFMKVRGITEYCESVGDLFLAECLEVHIPSAQYLRHMKTVLRRLADLNNGADFTLTRRLPEPAPPSQFAGLLESYLESCVRMGNKEDTVQGKRRFCREFLRNLIGVGCSGICDINTTLVCQAVLKLSNKDSYAVIRSFLRYLFETSVIKHDLSGVIPKYRRQAILPTTYTDDEINRLEKTIDLSTKTGKRDHAIFLLASRLGMRSGDIVELAFDNICFSRNSIKITQNKTGQPLSLPLLPEIREAILGYIRNARPNADNPYVFNRATAPFGKMNTSVIRHALTGYFRAAGVDISNKKHGAHSLRSSMASSMVNNDVPYEIVRKALGHADPQAIKHYAKLDIENLRLYAIDPPAPTGEFALALQGRDRA